ncbi:hypothetical protein [Nonomuraea lactucae]|uniref:hypothetical protein n=1 Tax=Nonomuraea lactucae TaxID=2249762 RepID=UPI0013B38370|nr:hypothetical protein [Nonomuraea lactucae]
MLTGHISPAIPCRKAVARPKVFVGDLAPEPLAEIGPEAAPPAPKPWTRDEFREYLVRRGVKDCMAERALGIEGILDLVEAHGLLEKQPNTMNLLNAEIA